MSETFAGRCLCGAVRFEALGQPKGVFWCHCDSSRRHSGAPVSVFVGFENEAVTVPEAPSPNIPRFSRPAGFSNGLAVRSHIFPWTGRA
jgi:hypothetical protein